MKRKWWLLGTVVLAVLLSLCSFGVRLRIAPRWMLSRALGVTLTELDTRFEKSPAHLLVPALDWMEHQNASLQMETQLDHLGVVRLDVEIQTQLNPCRVKAAGTVVTGGKVLDLDLFLDQNFAAVSSGGLLDGNYYGITYGSFSRDIRSRELLAALIGTQTISQWEESVSGLQKAMSREISIPDFSLDDVPGMLYGILALKPQVGREEIQISGQQVNADTVSFHAAGREIAAIAEPYLDQLDPELRNLIRELEAAPDSAVSAVFCLYKEKLAQIRICLQSSDRSIRIVADLGQSPVSNPLCLELEIREGEDLNRFTMTVDTKSGDDHYAETFCIAQTQNGIRHSGQLDYDWDLSSGELTLALLLNDRKADLRMNLAGEGDSLTFRTQDAAPILNLFLKKPVSKPVICTLNLRAGRSVSVPEYRNLDQWSMEELFTLLTGFGGLIGLKMP